MINKLNASSKQTFPRSSGFRSKVGGIRQHGNSISGVSNLQLQKPGKQGSIMTKSTSNKHVSVGPRNTTVSLMNVGQPSWKNPHQSVEKLYSKNFLSKINMFGSLSNSSTVNQPKRLNLHKQSVISNQSLNSRLNNKVRPNNNPFNDVQSFSSNGMGQIVGLNMNTLVSKKNINPTFNVARKTLDVQVKGKVVDQE